MSEELVTAQAREGSFCGIPVKRCLVMFNNDTKFDLTTYIFFANNSFSYFIQNEFLKFNCALWV